MTMIDQLIDDLEEILGSEELIMKIISNIPLEKHTRIKEYIHALSKRHMELDEMKKARERAFVEKLFGLDTLVEVFHGYDIKKGDKLCIISDSITSERIWRKTISYREVLKYNHFHEIKFKKLEIERAKLAEFQEANLEGWIIENGNPFSIEETIYFHTTIFNSNIKQIYKLPKN